MRNKDVTGDKHPAPGAAARFHEGGVYNHPVGAGACDSERDGASVIDADHSEGGVGAQREASAGKWHGASGMVPEDTTVGLAAPEVSSVTPAT